MPYDAPGERTRVTATRELVSGQPTALDNRRGICAKVQQIDRFVNPLSDEATHIQVGEDFVLFETGVHEVPLEGSLVGADVGDRIWVDPDDDALTTSSGGNALPLGVIEEIDSTRDPEVGRVNLSAWWAF